MLISKRPPSSKREGLRAKHSSPIAQQFTHLFCLPQNRSREHSPQGTPRQAPQPASTPQILASSAQEILDAHRDETLLDFQKSPITMRIPLPQPDQLGHHRTRCNRSALDELYFHGSDRPARFNLALGSTCSALRWQSSS